MTLLSMTRGDRQSFTVTLTDPAGEPLELDGIDLTFTVKADYADDDHLIQKTVGDGIALGETDGEAIITIEPEDTADVVRPRNYVWDIQVDGPEGDVRTPLTGTLRIRHDVTR